MCDDCSQICDYWRIVLQDINKLIEEYEEGGHLLDFFNKIKEEMYGVLE